MFLVTGGAGFLGQALVRYLASRGCLVRSLDVLAHEFPEFGGEVEVVQSDIQDDSSVDEAVEGCEVVIHNAALVPVTKAGQAFWEVNVEGTRNVLQASLARGVRKVVYISSSSVYGLPEEVPIVEETPLAPFGEYGRSKAAAEELCGQFKEDGLDVTILRPRTILGPGRLGILAILFDRLSRGRSLFVLGPGSNRFQLVSVHDMVSAVYLAATTPCRYEDFNVGAEVFETLRADLESLAAHAGTGSRVLSLPARPMRFLLKLQEALRLGPVVDYHYNIITHDVVFSTDRLQRKLGWRAQYSNQQALAEAYDWYLANRQRADATNGSPHLRGVQGRLLGVILRFL